MYSPSLTLNLLLNWFTINSLESAYVIQQYHAMHTGSLSRFTGISETLFI